MQLSLFWPVKMDVPGRVTEVVLLENLLPVVCNLFDSRKQSDGMIREKIEICYTTHDT